MSNMRAGAEGKSLIAQYWSPWTWLTIEGVTGNPGCQSSVDYLMIFQALSNIRENVWFYCCNSHIPHFLLEVRYN